MSLPLADVKIIEYGNEICGPFCGKLMADLGAEVIKIEEPGKGDTSRKRGPFKGDVPDEEKSGLFLYLNANKLSITLKLGSPKSKEIFLKLIKDVDILVEDTAPGTLTKLGLDYEKVLKRINHSLIITSITPFGQTGPYKGYKANNLTLWHMGGIGQMTPRLAALQGMAEREPQKFLEMSDFTSAITAAAATMCALRVQRKSGIGQRVDLSRLEATFLSLGPFGEYWPYEHRESHRLSKSEGAPETFVQCKDGWIYLNGREQPHWQRFLEMMGNPAWAQEEAFKDKESRAEHWDRLKQLITEWTIQHTTKEIFNEARVKKIPLAPVNTIGEILENEQLKERKYFFSMDHPKAGKVTCPGVPYRFSTIEASIRRPAPLLGEHNELVYEQKLGYSKEEMGQMHDKGII